MIRCWDPRDAPLLKEAIDSSLEHLRPWMAWAASEPQPLEEKIVLLRRFRGRFDLGRDFVYGIFDRDEKQVLGGTGLHSRARDDAFEIGYWIRASRINEGIATEVTAALTRVAFDLCGVERVDVRVDPENAASLAVPRKLGYVEEATLRRRLPPHADGIRRDVVLFSLAPEDYAETPSAAAAIEVYDALGARVL